MSRQPDSPAWQRVVLVGILAGALIGFALCLVRVARGEEPRNDLSIADMAAQLAQLPPLSRSHASCPAAGSLFEVGNKPLLREWLRLVGNIGVGLDAPAADALSIAGKERIRAAAAVAKELNLPRLDVVFFCAPYAWDGAAIPADPRDNAALGAQATYLARRLPWCRQWCRDLSTTCGIPVVPSLLIADLEMWHCDPANVQAIQTAATTFESLAKGAGFSCAILWYDLGAWSLPSGGWTAASYLPPGFQTSRWCSSSLYHGSQRREIIEKYAVTCGKNPGLPVAPFLSLDARWSPVWGAIATERPVRNERQSLWWLGNQVHDPRRWGSAPPYAPWDRAPVIVFWPGPGYSAECWGALYAYALGAAAVSNPNAPRPVAWPELTGTLSK